MGELRLDPTSVILDQRFLARLMLGHLRRHIGQRRPVELCADGGKILLRRLLAGQEVLRENVGYSGPDMVGDENDVAVVADMNQLTAEDNKPDTAFTLGARHEDAPALRAVVENDARFGMAEQLAERLPVDLAPRRSC